jgi:hypothetical protein
MPKLEAAHHEEHEQREGDHGFDHDRRALALASPLRV